MKMVLNNVFRPPYRPSSNGLAERAVQTLKKALRSNGESNIELSISKFLLQYRITPHSTTNISPSEMLMSRRIRSKLDCIFPYKDEIHTETIISKEELKSPKQWKPGDCVLAVDFRQGRRWVERRIEDVKNRIVWIKLPDGRNIRRHIDHVRSRQIAREHQNTENNQLEKSETNCDHRVVDETTQEKVPISIPDVNATSEIEPVSPTTQPTTNTGVVPRIV